MFGDWLLIQKIHALGGIAMATLFFLGVAYYGNQSPKPHLITVVIDDLGWRDVGARGAEYKTPYLDKLIRKESVFLDKYYVTSACTPSRAALLTGRHPWNIDIYSWYFSKACSSPHIPYDVATVAESLKTAGYQTHAFGKWHVGYLDTKATPFGRGFDSFSGMLQGAEDYYGHTDNGLFDWFRSDKEKIRIDWSASGTYSTDIIHDDYMKVINSWSYGDDPLYMYIAFQAPHAPVMNPPYNFTACDVVDDDLRYIYCNMMNYLDERIGMMVQGLKDKGMWDDSLIVITTDNGAAQITAGDNWYEAGAGWNYPLRGSKCTTFEGGVRGFGMITGGKVPERLRGTTNHELLNVVDVVTGQTAMAGVSEHETDGINLFDTVFKERKGHDRIILDLYSWETTPDLRFDSGIIEGKWKYVDVQSADYMNGFLLKKDGYWVNVSGPSVEPEDRCWGGCLFNIDDDPFEYNNIINDYPEIAYRLQGYLNESAKVENGYTFPYNPVTEEKCEEISEKAGAWIPMNYGPLGQKHKSD